MQAFEVKRRIAVTGLRVNSLLKTSSAKMKTQNRAAAGHLIDTLKFMGQLDIPFRGHRDSGCRVLVSDIKDIDTSTENFRAILQLHSKGNSGLAAHLKGSPSKATYLSPDIQNELIILIGKEILSSISSQVKDASCFANENQ